MDDSDENIKILEAFANSENKQLNKELQAIIYSVAKTGKYRIPWDLLKPLYLCAMDEVLKDFIEKYPPKTADGIDTVKVEELKKLAVSLRESFSKFTSAPFTIQRISELLDHPRKHYLNTVKYFRGLEKNIMVISTVEPEPPGERPAKKARMKEIVNDSEERDRVAPEATSSEPSVDNSNLQETAVNHRLSPQGESSPVAEEARSENNSTDDVPRAQKHESNASEPMGETKPGETDMDSATEQAVENKATDAAPSSSDDPMGDA